VKAGDRILFGKWSGTEVKIDGEDLLIMKESDILGIVDAPASTQKKPRKGPKRIRSIAPQPFLRGGPGASGNER
jgi:hypothetical protein